MSLQEKIDQDLRQAMVSKDAMKLSTLRFLKSAVKYSAIEKKTDVLGDTDVQQVILRQIKQHRESIDQFVKAGRKDLAQKEALEATVLESYLPRQLSDSELQAAVQIAVNEAGPSSKKDFGRLMKTLTKKLQGQAESRRISEILGKILQ